MFIENAGLTFVVKKNVLLDLVFQKYVIIIAKINVLQVFNLQKVIIMYK